MSDNIDFATFAHAEKSWTGNQALTTSFADVTTLDVSSFPTGAVVAIMTVANYGGDVNGAGTTSRIVYNGATLHTSYMVTFWARSNTCLATFTKAAGADTVTFRASKDNANSSCNCLNIQFVAWRIG